MLLTAIDLAKYLRISEPTIYRMIRRGEVKFKKIKRTWVVRMEDVEGWFKKP